MPRVKFVSSIKNCEQVKKDKEKNPFIYGEQYNCCGRISNTPWTCARYTSDEQFIASNVARKYTQPLWQSTWTQSQKFQDTMFVYHNAWAPNLRPHYPPQHLLRRTDRWRCHTWTCKCLNCWSAWCEPRKQRWTGRNPVPNEKKK